MKMHRNGYAMARFWEDEVVGWWFWKTKFNGDVDDGDFGSFVLEGKGRWVCKGDWVWR